MKKILAIVLAALVAGCAGVVKVEGDQVVNNRMSVKLPDAWNKFSAPGTAQPFDSWTQEGMTLDHLRLWAGIKPGQALIMKPPSSPSQQTAPRIPTYTQGMAPDQLVSLFETMYAIDGSHVTMSRVEPTVFAGEKGVRFEFAVVRKGDDVQLKGVGWVAVRKDELFAATFVAPRLAFFPRLLPKAEGVVNSAVIRG
jgi:hypothetical protein